MTSLALASAPAAFFEPVSCYVCGSTEHDDFITAEDDLGGTPGTFRFVRCTRCALAYQNPRVALEHIGAYYDDDYIAHRRKRDWGLLTPLFERAMNQLDADKDRHRLALCDARRRQPGTRCRMRRRHLPSASAQPVRGARRGSGLQGPDVCPVAP